MSDQADNKAAALKVGTAWAGTGLAKWLGTIGVTDWSDVSALLASVLSVIVIIDYLWRWWRRRRPVHETRPGEL